MFLDCYSNKLKNKLLNLVKRFTGIDKMLTTLNCLRLKHFVYITFVYLTRFTTRFSKLT